MSRLIRTKDATMAPRVLQGGSVHHSFEEVLPEPMETQLRKTV